MAAALRLLQGLLALVLLSVAAGAWAQRKPYDIAPAPAWVEPLAPDLSIAAPADQVTRGVHYLLSDMQVRVDGTQRVSYRHMASRALDVQGVESIANLELRFDPSYQRLTLHSVQIRRGRQTLSRLHSAQVRVLQRETELEALIFDGSMTASIILDDVRVGDVVEYAYSLAGHNPVFGNRHFGNFALQWGVPVAQVHARLLWPLNRELRMRRLNQAPEPAVSEGPTHRDHRWHLFGVAGKPLEEDVPAWFEPYPGVQWSEFGDWAAVVQWALPLYRVPPQATPRVQAEIERIAALHPDAEQRLLAALRFVQREVRYLGMEVGSGSHAPSPPDVVLGRRFGDCKDKALLTVALMRGLGIEAHPALVNTSQRRAIRDWQASPGAFNHVVVRARLHGADIWVDPTRSPQQSRLSGLAQADYGPSLVIDEGSDRLVTMAGDAALKHRRSMRTVLDSRDGFDRPATYTVTTVAEGPAADALRASIASQSRDKLQRQYLNFYAGYYDDLRMAAPIDIVDELEANRLTLTEHYVIGKFWARSTKNQRLETLIRAPDMLSLLGEPQGKLRESPLSLAHPVTLSHVTEVLLPQSWDGRNDRMRVDDPAFAFERVEEWQGSTLRLTDRFETRLDHIAARDIERYVGNLDKARRSLRYTLFYNDLPVDAAPTPTLHWLPAVTFTLALVGLGVLAGRLHRWDPEPGEPVALGPRDRDDWVMLIPLGIALAMHELAWQLWKGRSALNTDTWLSITTAGNAAYNAWWAPALLFSMVAKLALLAGGLLALWLCFTRRSSLPRVFQALVLATLAAAVLDALLVARIPILARAISAPETSTLLGAGIVCAMWIPYARHAPGIQATFVRRRRGPPPQAPKESPSPLPSTAAPPA